MEQIQVRAASLGIEFRLHAHNPSIPQRIAIVFGWLHSQHKHVSKYSNVYFEEGFHIFQMTSVGGSVMRSSPKRKERVKDLLTLVSDLFPNDPLVVIHSMSNGGMAMYLDALEMVSGDARFVGWKKWIRGVIFDSCPADCTAHSFSTAYSSWVRNPILRFIMFWLCYTFIAITSLPFEMVGVTANRLAGFSLLLEHELHKKTPILYIYSEADQLTRYQYVEDIITSHRNLGHNVLALKFQDSGHVMHLSKYPKEYKNAIIETTQKLK